MDRAELETRLRMECPTVAERAIAGIASCAKLVPHRSQDSAISIGATKFGGDPDLAPGNEFPRWDEEHGGSPLALVAQINLAEVAEIDLGNGLPAAGLLSFFYDTDEMPSSLDEEGVTSGWRVLYTPTPRELVRLRADARPRHPIQVCAANVQRGWSIPDFWSVNPEDNSVPAAERESYFDILAALDVGAAQLLGNAYPVQGPIEAEAAHDSGDVRRARKNGFASEEIAQIQRWRLLFQVNTNKDLDVMWGDVGKIYYAIRKQDLAARNFNETMLIFQCH